VIGLILAVALQVDAPSPSPSAMPSPTARPAPTAKPLLQPTPPYLIGPKGWLTIPYPAHRSAANFPRVGGWTRYTDRGEETIVVTRFYSSGRTAQGLAQHDGAMYVGRGGYPTMISSRPHPLCGGTVPGWEVVSRQGDGVGSHTMDMLYAVDSVRGYTAEYYRESAYPPDPQAVVALRSFCPTHARILTATVVRGAIVVPSSWVPEDVSLTYHLPAGSAMLYSIPYDGQAIMVFREDSPDGVSADVNADIDYAIRHMGKDPYTIVSRKAIQLCDGDGWIVDVRWTEPRHDYLETIVFHFGAPDTYVAIYRRSASSRTLTPAIKAVSSLCPPK